MNRDNKAYIIAMLIIGLFVTSFLTISLIRHKKQNNNTIGEETVKDSLISQNKLKEIYGWNDVILWSESKESFEKAYHTKLTWLNYPMEFVWHPECVNPIGGGEEWPHIKACFYYRFPTGKPKIPELIAKESQNKNLVIIGSLYSYGQKFSGTVYWYE